MVDAWPLDLQAREVSVLGAEVRRDLLYQPEAFTAVRIPAFLDLSTFLVGQL